MTETHYDILGLPETATHEEIKKTYRKLSLQYHPDRPGGDQTKYQKINEAYEILGDEQKKQEYDMMRNSPFSKMGGQHPNVDEVFSNIFGIEHSTKLDYSANALYIANPNGLTGKCLSKTEIIELLDKFELVIVDEAYEIGRAHV